MLDIFQAAGWSITYILIILYSFRERIIAIPPIAIASNFAWETIALLQDFLRHSNLSNVGMCIHVFWFSLDLLIVMIYLCKCNSVYFNKWIFTCIYICESLFLFVIFHFTISGMLLSCFAIDLIMAVEWCFYGMNKELKINLLLTFIAIAKLIGDFLAWLCYRGNHFIVNIIGIFVLIINIGFLFILHIRTEQAKRKDCLP